MTCFLVSQDAGYGEKSLFSCDDDNDDSESKNIDDEVTNEVSDFDRAVFIEGRKVIGITLTTLQFW